MDISSIQKKIQLYWFEMTIQKLSHLELWNKTLISKFSQKVFLVFFDVCSSWTWLRFRKIEYLDFQEASFEIKASSSVGNTRVLQEFVVSGY